MHVYTHNTGQHQTTVQIYIVIRTHTHTHTCKHNLIYKAKIVCLSVCVFAIRARISCSVALKLTVVAGGQVIAGWTTPVLWFAESYPSISAFSFVDD